MLPAAHIRLARRFLAATPRIDIDVSKFESTLQESLGDLVQRSLDRDPEKAIARWEGMRGILDDERIDSLIKTEREGGDPYTQDQADQDIRHFTGETRSNMEKLAKGVQAAIKRAGRWMGSDVTIKAQEYNRDSEDTAQDSAQVYVHKGPMRPMSPSFTVFGDGDIDDVLDASDQDFFTDPALESDYFTLVQEIRRPGSSKSKGRTITLYTARPEKDRRTYEGARSVPSGIFLTTSYDRAEGLGSDLSGGRGRDIWKVRVKDTYLLQTLKAPGAKDYQAFHPSGKVPVEGTELVYEQGTKMASDPYDGETRTYTVTGRGEALDKLEKVMVGMHTMGSWGSSREIAFDFDGDGADQLDIKELKDKALDKFDTENDTIYPTRLQWTKEKKKRKAAMSTRQEQAQRIARQFLAGQSGWERFVLGALKKAEKQFTESVKRVTGGKNSAVRLSIQNNRIEATVWIDLTEPGAKPSFGKVPPASAEAKEEARDYGKAILGPAFSGVEPHKAIPGMWLARGYDNLDFLLQ